MNGSTVTSPVHVVVGTADTAHHVTEINVYVDNVSVFKTTTATSVDTNVNIAAGTHVLRTQTWDTSGTIYRDSVTFTVGSGTPQTTVSVSPTSANLLVNTTQQFTATVTNNSNTSVNWSVDGVAGGNSTTGTVSTSGLYTAPASAGSHTVTATSVADTTKSASASVSVTTQQGTCSPPTSNGIVICTPQDGATVNSPVAVQAFAQVTGTIYRFELWSDGVKVASVANSGTMNLSVPMTNGTHAWTFDARNTDSTSKFTKSITITVGSGTPTTTVTVSPTSANLQVNATQQFTATVTNNSNTSVTWSVDGVAGGNTTTGTISSSGLYTAPAAAGSHTVKATSVGDTTKSASASVTVTSTSSCSPPTTNGIVVCTPQNGATVNSPVAVQAFAKVTGTIYRFELWSDGVKVASVSNSGTMNVSVAMSAGAHAWTFVARNTDSSSEVTQPINITVGSGGGGSVTVSPKQMVLTPEQTQQYTASTAVTWSVDGVAGGNSTVGTISSSGLYTPPSSAGPHTVTATSTADSTQTASAMVYVDTYAGVFTYHNNTSRTGENTEEAALNPSNVNTSKFGKLFSRTVDGFVFAQPLYVRAVNVSGVGVRNVVYVATEHASVYAFDADGKTTSPLWKRSFINPAAGINVVTNTEVTSSDSGPEVCITSTPVIDNATGTMYVVVRTNENGTYFQRLHAISLATGADKMTPGTISATVNGSGVGGDGSGHINFDPLIQNQRAALLLANGNVYIAWASHGDHGNYHGWIMAYSASTLQRVGVLNVTPNGKLGGIWMGGAGPSADSSGNVYFTTGNGTNDVATSGIDFGDTYMKVNPSVAPLDYFTPFDQSSLNSGDLDVASSGVLLLPDQSGAHPHVMVGSAKRGDVYVIDRDNLGGFHAGSNSNAVQYLPRAVGLNTAEDQFFGIPSYWNGNIYFAGSFDHLRQFTVSGGLLSTQAVHTSPEVLSSDRAAEPVISANGTSDGIVWVIATDTYASSTAPAVLHAYDASNVGTELWNSAQNSSRDAGGKVVKFTTPTVANGRVYMGTRTELDVFGLLP